MLLTTVWWAGRRVIALTLACMALVFFVTAALMWHDLPPALWMALVGAGQPFLMAWIYRRRLNHTGWAPESQQDVAALLFAAVSSSLLLALVGGFPTLNPSDLPTAFLWWWVLRNTVFCFVGGVTFMVMFYGPRHGALAPTSWLNRIGLAITTVRLRLRQLPRPVAARCRGW